MRKTLATRMILGVLCLWLFMAGASEPTVLPSYTNAIITSAGLPIQATITVYAAGTTNVSTIYSDAGGTTPLANPFTTAPQDGRYVQGFFDLLGIVQLNNADSKWFSPTTAMTGYIFAGFVFWAFCFFMSRYSQMIERRLAKGDRK